MKVGDFIAGYEIVARLSSGGMATVFLGKRGGAGGFAKHVAIKVVHPHLSEDPAFVEMFLDEARLSARIEHPNVVHVHDLGDADGTYFMAMEYVAGTSLAQLLRVVGQKKLRLAPEVAVAIVMRLASGLHAAHELTNEAGENLGVVHRDVSPHNVLLAFKGHVKLIDFGIAKAAERSQNTQGALLKGKVRYMAPEQAFGLRVDRRTDLYALGIMLWEMLTSRRLFDGESDLQVLEAVRDPKVRPPGTLVSRLPPALDAIVMSALSRDPDLRPDSCEVLRQKLATAMPQALAIDAPHIADLLGVLMKDVIAAEQSKLGNLTQLSMILGAPSASPNAQQLVERLALPMSARSLAPDPSRQAADAAARSTRPPAPSPGSTKPTVRFGPPPPAAPGQARPTLRMSQPPVPMPPPPGGALALPPPVVVIGGPASPGASSAVAELPVVPLEISVAVSLENLPGFSSPTGHSDATPSWVQPKSGEGSGVVATPMGADPAGRESTSPSIVPPSPYLQPIGDIPEPPEAVSSPDSRRGRWVAGVGLGVVVVLALAGWGIYLARSGMTSAPLAASAPSVPPTVPSAVIPPAVVPPAVVPPAPAAGAASGTAEAAPVDAAPSAAQAGAALSPVPAAVAPTSAPVAVAPTSAPVVPRPSAAVAVTPAPSTPAASPVRAPRAVPTRPAPTRVVPTPSTRPTAPSAREVDGTPLADDVF